MILTLILILTTNSIQSIKMQKMLFMKLMLRSIVLKRSLEKDMDSGNCQNLLFMKGMEIRVRVRLLLGITIIMANTILHEHILFDLTYVYNFQFFYC